MSIPRRGRAAGLALAALGALACASCISTFKDQAPVPGTNKRLVVGWQDSFPGPKAKIWVEEDGRFTEVKVVEGGR